MNWSHEDLWHAIETGVMLGGSLLAFLVKSKTGEILAKIALLKTELTGEINQVRSDLMAHERLDIAELRSVRELIQEKCK